MGAPKQKWTAEEEAALRAGVEKYGPGKWRAIQKDSKFGPCLISRSNVDLKDKWRNMSVSANGVGSARERAKPLAVMSPPGMLTLMDEAFTIDPLAIMAPTDGSYDSKSNGADTSSDHKSLGPRYDDMVLEAVLGLNEPDGSSSAAIANYIEERYPVPSNFRRLLTTKLKSLALSGKLMKVRQNYKINDGKESPLVAEVAEEREQPARWSDAKPPKEGQNQQPEGRSDDADRMPTPRFPRDSRDSSRKMRSDLVPHKKPKMDIEQIARAKVKTAEDAARAAIVAVTEAEAAAAAAEQAAWDAEAAEAEAEVLEAAAEAAMAAIRPPKKSLRAVAIAQEVVVNS
ncbi:hypothetical protein CY35_09G073800 [Sphagnum magellanicum]|nr:hypothetical protein CY35_09G073800 [Sphagnum magellanicum]KAH9552573.1 hypothetical protein CY35_09G073800 [Sphagnum magellanicum]